MSVIVCSFYYSASHSQAAMMNYSIPLQEFRIAPEIHFYYLTTCWHVFNIYNFDGHEQHRHEGTWKAKPKQTRQLSELVLLLTAQHVTARLSSVSLLARFRTPPKAKFHVFRQIKRGDEKSILKFFFDFLIRTSCSFDQANKKKSVMYTLKLK